MRAARTLLEKNNVCIVFFRSHLARLCFLFTQQDILYFHSAYTLAMRK